jgi:hypothetical protein
MFTMSSDVVMYSCFLDRCHRLVLGWLLGVLQLYDEVVGRARYAVCTNSENSSQPKGNLCLHYRKKTIFRWPGAAESKVYPSKVVYF